MKSALRSQALAKRHDAQVAVGKKAGSSIAEHFLKTIVWTANDVIAGYCPLGDEADVRPLLTRLHALGGKTALPVVRKKNAPLIFRQWTVGEPLEAGLHGTQHPLARAAETTPTIVLVPLLAFDPAGRRLGFGGGYYDRTLAALRATRTIQAIGIAFAAQEIHTIPAEPHDQTLDWIVTENGARRFAQ